MADLDNTTKRKLELIFDMSGGYVLDFSNPRFADFVKTAIGIDPYEKYPPASKAVLLRTIWHEEPMPLVAKLNLELLEHWRVGKLIADEEPKSSEVTLHDELKAQFAALVDTADPASTEFLAKDFSHVDLTALPRELTSQQVVEARLTEIERCLQANAPLAVIFLVGSTLEGLLMELAMAHAATFTGSSAAPRARGVPKPVQDWKLGELIAVARDLGVLGEDVARHADHVRGFRNYIHPRQQLRESFEPRLETARIAQQVLRAALVDLEKLTTGRGVSA
ncbi:hypothetical protein H0B56_08255 [Haloechinothrix sp. YIM 98757]|uniref:Uncharacterized protein n=1 Tax=Haloechinothrix aidingensis TaxID=2752311 RepID=A0A838A6M4_9PSEU|nr:hypothetical protein [Haloechinothrix aidingensis]MBA0125530.1 hypothetical protein [Haloechinothrix aidingensis]